MLLVYGTAARVQFFVGEKWPCNLSHQFSRLIVKVVKVVSVVLASVFVRLDIRWSRAVLPYSLGSLTEDLRDMDLGPF